MATGFIYVLSCYPILFLGANKGQQSNDLLFSTLLPVRKKDIVSARLFTVIIMQFAFIAIMSILYPLALYLQTVITVNEGEAIYDVGLGLNGYVSVIAIALVGFAIADLVFFSIYYKNGRSIVASTLLTLLGFVVYLGVFTIAIPYIPGCEWYKDVLCNRGIGVQFIVLAVALIIYVAIHFLVYKVSAKELEQVDF